MSGNDRCASTSQMRNPSIMPCARSSNLHRPSGNTRQPNRLRRLLIDPGELRFYRCANGGIDNPPLPVLRLAPSFVVCARRRWEPDATTMQTAVRSTLQQAQQPRVQPALASALRAVAPAALLSDPRPSWRGFFVAFSYWFGFYFGGYRQTPARAGARTLFD